MTYDKIEPTCVRLDRMPLSESIIGKHYAVGPYAPEQTNDTYLYCVRNLRGVVVVLARTTFDAASWFVALEEGDPAAFGALDAAKGPLKLDDDHHLWRIREDYTCLKIQRAINNRRPYLRRLAHCHSALTFAHRRLLRLERTPRRIHRAEQLRTALAKIADLLLGG